MSIEARAVAVAPFSLSRSPFPAPDGIEIMRRSPWSSCWWCGDPHDGRPRCDRCGQKHGDAVPPVRWWETNRVDMIWWFEHRMTMVAEAFQVDDIVVGEHIERSYPPA